MQPTAIAPGLALALNAAPAHPKRRFERLKLASPEESSLILW
ncbi:MAG: hypothetical protein QHJ82_09810 [Verrucomicrobiota bacterium]|nr:hypothetical protein [Verrucomicrobiota bacterium]